MSTTLVVTQPFGPYSLNDQIVVADAIAATLLQTYSGRLQFVSTDSSVPPAGGGTTTPPITGGVTIDQVNAAITSAFSARTFAPTGAALQALIDQRFTVDLAAQGSGSGVSTAQSIVNSLIFG